MEKSLRKRARGLLTVGLDEGGLRCSSRRHAFYVPYDEIVDAAIDNPFIGRTVLVLHLAREEAPLRIQLANANPFDVLGAVLVHVARPHPSTRIPALARGDSALSEWLERVRRLATGADKGSYRDAAVCPLDLAALAAALADENASCDERAAAAHALLEIDTDETLPVVAHVLVTRAVPPMVLVASRLGRGGRAFVDEELLADLCALLPARDAAAVPALSGQAQDDSQVHRAAAAIERAKKDAARAFEAAAASGSRGRKLHPLTASGALDTSRWIGRSWGL
jgi:hypothetical protein